MHIAALPIFTGLYPRASSRKMACKTMAVEGRIDVLVLIVALPWLALGTVADRG